MYNYPGQYGQPPGYGSYPGAPPPVMPPGTAGAPGMMAPPGVGAAPGFAPPNPSLPPRPAGLPSSFQGPANMPNINFSAPVIRLGTSGPPKDGGMFGGGAGAGARGPNAEAGGARRGLGMGDMRGLDQPRASVALVPPTREEVMRTIFVGKIPPSVSDEDVYSVLKAAGNLRRWMRALDVDDKPCTFGFAEYEDAESLETAAEVLQDVEVPATKVDPNKSQNGETEMKEVEKVKLLIQVDDASRKYAEEWSEKRGEGEAAVQFRIDTAKENLARAIAGLFDPSVRVPEDITMRDVETSDPITGEVLTIQLSADDELSEIPAEMRETVAAEISAFRDRSNRRDIERMRREEEMEAAERRGAARANRLGSPPYAAPTGPAGNNSSSNVPVGPRSGGGAPAGPRGFQNGVSFVNSNGEAPRYQTTAAGASSRDDEDTDASDSEIERRRQARAKAEQEKAFLDHERRWLNRERSRAAALERERKRDADDEGGAARERERALKTLNEWDDDAEMARRQDEYYRDRGAWARSRAAFRDRERDADDADRAAEERERRRDAERREQARGMADSFLERQAEELGARAAAREREAPQQRLKISLGAAAERRVAAQQAAQTKRSVAEVEGLLEDEEDEAAAAGVKRTLVPIKFDTAAEAAGLTEEERQVAVRRLAADIPTDRERLWAWKVQWDFVDDAILAEQIRPFVEKKMLEYLGVQEEILVQVIEEHIKKRGSPEELVKELEGPLDEEAEVLVKKLWRMLIFCSESEKRGLSN